MSYGSCEVLIIQAKVATFGRLARSMVVTRPTSCGANTVLAAFSNLIFSFIPTLQFVRRLFAQITRDSL